MNPPDEHDPEYADALAEFEAATGTTPDLEPDTPTDADTIAARFLDVHQVIAMQPPAPLIDGLLYMDTTAMMYGPSGTGKTFVALDLALSIASGRPWWHSCAVTPGKVLYIYAEGVAGAGDRIRAWQHHNNRDAGTIMFYPSALNIYEQRWADALAVIVAREQPVLVVVDTLARSTAGAEENSAKDAGIIVAHLDVIRRAAGCCVLIVHHTGKDTTKGGRGSSAFRGAMDTEIELNGDVHHLIMKNTKQKDTAEHPPLYLRWEPVNGTDSGVLIQGRSDDELDDQTMVVWEALNAIETPEGVTAGDWIAAAIERTGKGRARIQEHKKTLHAKGLVRSEGKGNAVRWWTINPEE